MSFTIILLLIFLVTLILIIWGFSKSKFRTKKIFKILTIMFLLISCVICGAYLYSQRSSSFIFTKTTVLTEENIGGLRLYEKLDSKEFIARYGTNLQKTDNALFDYYKLSDGLEIATNKDRQIIRIIKNTDSDNNIKTSKGITLESSVDEIIEAYGENYYKRSSDFGVPVIGYVDKKENITIEFFYYQNKVTHIRFDITSME